MKTSLVLVSLAVCVGVALLMGGCGKQADRDVRFPDPNLELAIREAIDKPTGEITKADLVGVTELEAPNRGIRNLEGLQHCTDLAELFLSRNQISDLTPLSGLTHLTALWLFDTPFSRMSDS